MAEATMKTLGEHPNGHVTVKVMCGVCDYVEYTMRRTGSLSSASEILKDHLEQHEPGRALDIEVDWEPSGICPVCEDGIGMIGWDEDGNGVKCKDCGTTWDLDGTNGERSE